MRTAWKSVLYIFALLILMDSSVEASVGLLPKGHDAVFTLDSTWGKHVINRERILRERLRPYWRQNPPLFTVPQFLNGLRGAKQGDTLVVRVLAIRVEFPYEDPDDPRTTGRGKFILEDNGRDPILRITDDGDTVFNPLYDPPHTKTYFEHLLEYVADYYRNATYGKVKIEFVVVPEGESTAYQLPHPMVYYGDTANWIYGLAAIIRDALKAADRDTLLNIDFDDLDNNGMVDAEEGVLDRYVIFHAGSAWQTDMGDTPFDLPAVYVPPGVLQYAFGKPFVVLNEGADTVYDAAVMSETMSQDGVEVKLHATLVHESMHNFFAAPDLYDVSWPPERIGIGAWGIMASGGYLGYKGETDTIPEGLIAPLPNAFERWWIDYIVRLIWGDGGIFYGSVFQTVTPSNSVDSFTVWPSAVLTDSLGRFLTNPHALPRIYKIPINSHEYFLVEYKLDDVDGDGWVKGLWRDGVFVSFFGENDFLLPGKGLLIWHIDEDLVWDRYAYNELEVGDPMAVDLEEADGVQDLEHWTDMRPYPYTWFGCPYDPYFEGNNTEFSDYTRPSSRDNNGSFTHIRIFDISAPDSAMSFKLVRSFTQEGFPRRLIPEVVLRDSTPYIGFTRLELDVKSTFLKPDGDFIVAVANLTVDSTFEDWHTGEIDTLDHWNEIRIFLLDQTGLPIASRTLKDEGFTYGIALTNFGDDTASLKLVFSTDYGKLFAVDPTTMADLWNPPIDLPDGSVCPPVAFGDKILIGSDNEELHLIDRNGEILHSIFVGTPVRTPPAVKDGTIWLLSTDGRLLKIDGATFEVQDTLFEPLVLESRIPPVIGDLDADGKDDIVIVRNDGTLAVVKPDGTVKWSVKLDGEPEGGLALGDIDDDGYLEVAIVSQNKLFVFNHLGGLMSDFPVGLPADSSASQILIADADGDSTMDLIVAVGEHGIFAFDHRGREIRGYPIQLNGKADIEIQQLDDDEHRELVAFDTKGFVYAWDMPSAYPHWPMFGSDVGNTGVFNSDSAALTSPQPHAAAVERVYFYPNPTFNGFTNLRVLAYEFSEVKVEIFNLSGERLKTLGPFVLNGGDYEDIRLNLTDLASGVYYVRLTFMGEIGERTRILKLAIER